VREEDRIACRPTASDHSYWTSSFSPCGR
jgi:hypothetical protein